MCKKGQNYLHIKITKFKLRCNCSDYSISVSCSVHYKLYIINVRRSLICVSYCMTTNIGKGDNVISLGARARGS